MRLKKGGPSRGTLEVQRAEARSTSRPRRGWLWRSRHRLFLALRLLRKGEKERVERSRGIR
jgi:hypothetical protein